MSAATASRLRPRRDPLRLLLSAEPWTAVAYLASYLLVGTGLFVVAVTVLVTAASLSILWIGIRCWPPPPSSSAAAPRSSGGGCG
jgi:hypothetical protein